MRLFATRRVAVPILLAILCAFVGLETASAATGEPLPGIDVLVRKKPGPKPTKLHVGGGGAGGVIVIEAGAFGPGSQPFTGDVDLELDSVINIGTVGHVDHGRVRFVEGATPDQLQMEMTPMTLRSIDAIQVSFLDGGIELEDTWIVVRALGGGPSDPVEGQLALPTSTVLDPGSTSFVVDSFFDIEYDVYFTNSTTGNPEGPTLHGTMQLVLEELDLPIHRLDAAMGGNVCPGYDGSTLFDYSFTSPDGSFSLGLDTEVPEAPVAIDVNSMGSLKSLYR